MDMNDFKNIDINNLGTSPTPVKVLVMIVLLGVMCFLGYKFLISKQLETLEKKKAEEVVLKQTFEQKYHLSLIHI